ncbi:hypothetical protein KRR38_25175 [Novosphingobium sp. G106]|uniref:hypothetical protein n=1 Tax=Novosphingobium sp. G106 TaxID=2849500 RepID=UPI001C2D3755|nr:hypothetical protein [Novosphingobium sp. G106]MBV1690879.1 hypothetical protein [Novosphingobium sp. G106]
MRIIFRKSSISKTQMDRVLFAAPIVVALVLLFLFTQNQAVLASAWRSPLEVLSARSPGGRTPGALYNIKPERLASTTRSSPHLAVPPAERVLAATRERVPPPFAGLLPAEAPPLGLMNEGAPVLAGAEPMDLGLPGVVPFVSSPEGPGGPGCCIPQVTEDAPPPSPVPEPTTWLMNIVGLFLVGSMMRHRNRKLRALPLQA